MAKNSDLGDLSKKEVVDIDPTEAFDTYRKARQEQLQKVKEVLVRSSQGSKMDRKQIARALSALHQYGTMTDEIVTSLIGDLFRVIKAVAQTEVNVFALRTNLKTLVRVLEKKDIVNQEEMKEAHDNEILPEEIKGFGGDEKAEQVLRKEDVEKMAEETEQNV